MNYPVHQETDAEMQVRWARENKELRALLARQKAERLAAKAARATSPAAVKAAEAAANRAAALAARAAEVAAAPTTDKRKRAAIRSDGRRFDCLSDTVRMYGPGARSAIRDCCEGRRAKYKGFGWSWEASNG